MALQKEMRERVKLALRLKRSLVEYYRKREKKFKPIILARYFQGREIKGESDEINAVDWFIHCYRFRNGDSLIDRFIKENKNCLSESEVAILEGWKESFEGIFEVKSVDEDTVRLYNLIDEAEYTVTSNIGKQGLKRFSAGEFVVTRLVPLDDIYLLSGVSLHYPSEARSMLEEEALKIVKSNLPASLGKNKEKWAQGWQMQKKLRSPPMPANSGTTKDENGSRANFYTALPGWRRSSHLGAGEPDKESDSGDRRGTTKCSLQKESTRRRIA